MNTSLLHLAIRGMQGVQQLGAAAAEAAAPDGLAASLAAAVELALTLDRNSVAGKLSCMEAIAAPPRPASQPPLAGLLRCATVCFPCCLRRLWA